METKDQVNVIECMKAIFEQLNIQSENIFAIKADAKNV
jgi:hypothetical protein